MNSLIAVPFLALVLVMRWYRRAEPISMRAFGLVLIFVVMVQVAILTGIMVLHLHRNL
jgi:hypothetical protein